MFFCGRKMRLISATALLLVFGACNDEGDFAPVPGACRISNDQDASFFFRVSTFPIPVRVESAFTSEEKIQIRQAIDAWNGYGRYLIHEDFFEIVSEGEDLPDFNLRTADCLADVVGGASNTLVIMRGTTLSRPGRERVSGLSNVIGSTSRCSLGDRAERQMTVLHTERVDVDQISSVALHEFGHVLGLDHSCESNGGSYSYRACAGLDSNHPYRLAVMYPTLRTGGSSPERKDQPAQNDMDRLACRYGPR
jgi:hypothetical protein